MLKEGTPIVLWPAVPVIASTASRGAQEFAATLLGTPATEPELMRSKGSTTMTLITDLRGAVGGHR